MAAAHRAPVVQVRGGPMSFALSASNAFAMEAVKEK